MYSQPYIATWLTQVFQECHNGNWVRSTEDHTKYHGGDPRPIVSEYVPSHQSCENGTEDKSRTSEDERLSDGLLERVDVHDKGRLKDQSRQEDVEHQVRIHSSNSGEILEKTELLDVAGGAKGETKADQDDSVGNWGTLQDMSHQR